MKLGIVGYRYYENYEEFSEYVKDFIKGKDIELIISGNCPFGGADLLAKKFAKDNNIKFKEYSPNEQKYGKPKCYYVRNQLIADNSDELIAFVSNKSKGTWITIDMFKKNGKESYIINIFWCDSTSFLMYNSIKFICINSIILIFLFLCCK